MKKFRKTDSHFYAPGSNAAFNKAVGRAQQAELAAKQQEDFASKLSYLNEQHEFELEQKRKEESLYTASMVAGEIDYTDTDVIPIGVTTHGAGTQRFIMGSTDEFRDKWMQKTAADDQGGWIATSFRSEQARIAGVIEGLEGYERATGDYEYGDQYSAAAQFGLGVSGQEGDWGLSQSSGLEGIGWAIGATRNFLAENLQGSWLAGGEADLPTRDVVRPDGTRGREIIPQHWSGVQTDKEVYRYRGMAIGSPLWEAHHIEDPNFTEATKKAWVQNLFGDPANEQLAKMAGIVPADIMNAKSPAAAAATIAHKRTARLAGAWYEQSGRTEATMAFIQNLAATLVNDPDMQAEMGIAILSMGTSSIGSLSKMGGTLAMRGSRALSAIPHGAGRAKSFARWAGSPTLKAIGNPLLAQGKVFEMTGGLIRNLNPFQVGERIILRAAADVKWLRGVAAKGVTKESKALAVAVKGSRLGATGLIAKEVLLGTSDVTWKSGIVANMIDGAAGNFAAYASTRDEHYIWERQLYGETYDASKTDFHWFQGGMHSGAGSIATGALFGMVVGGAIRGLGLAIHDQKGVVLPEAKGVGKKVEPITRIANHFKEASKAKAKQNAGLIGNMMLDISGNGARKLAVAGGLVRQSMRRAGITSETAFLNADNILRFAQSRGVDISTAIKQATDSAGRISMKALQDVVERLEGTPQSKMRRKALRVARSLGQDVDGKDVRTAHALNTYRIEYMIENDKNITDEVGVEALDFAIERADGDVKESLIEFRENVNAVTDTMMGALSDNIRDMGDWDKLTFEQKKLILENYLAAIGHEDIKIDIKNIDDLRARITGEDLDLRTEVQRKAFIKSRDTLDAARKAKAEENNIKLKELEEELRQAEANRDKFERAESAPLGTKSSDADLEARYGEDANSRLADEAETDEEAFGKMAAKQEEADARAKQVDEVEEAAQRQLDEGGGQGPRTDEVKAEEPAPAPKLVDKWEAEQANVERIQAEITRVEQAEVTRVTAKNSADAKLRADRIESRIAELKADKSMSKAALREAILALDPGAKVPTRMALPARRKMLAELENKDADSGQSTIKFTQETENDARTSMALEELLKPLFVQDAIRRTGDGVDVMLYNKHMLGAIEGTPDSPSIGERVTFASLRSIKAMAEPGKHDARFTEGTVQWNSKLMAVATNKRASAARRILDGNRDLRQEAFKEVEDSGVMDMKVLEDVKKLIRKDFGIDVTSKNNETAGAGRSLVLEDAQNLYRDLTYIKKLEKLPAEQQGKLLTDPFAAAALGQPIAQKQLARDWFEFIRRAEASLGNETVTLHQIMSHHPPSGFEGMLHTTFRSAESRDKGGQILFNLREMRYIAEQRLAMADDQFRKAYLVKQADRIEQMSKGEKEMYGQIMTFDNQSAMTASFNRRLSEANTDSVDHRGRVDQRIADSGLEPEAWIERQRERFVQGVIEGWDSLPQGAAKDALANKLGILDYTRDTGITQTKGKVRNRDITYDTLGLTPERTAMADRIWEASHEQVGVDGVSHTDLYDGNVDSAWGYTVGRALIEAVSGTTTQSHQVRGLVDVEMVDGQLQVPRGGFLGRMSNNNFAKLYQQFVREEVQRHVLGMGSGTSGTRNVLKHMTAEDVEFILKDIEEIEALIKSWDGTDSNMPAALKERLNDIGYDSTSKLRFSPKEIIQDLNAKIGNFKTRFDDHVAMIMDMPPSVINMLHDEGNVISGLHASMFILGDVPNGKQKDLGKDFSGDAGLEGAVFQAGSWKDVWTHRSSEMFGSAKGLAESASLVGLKQTGEFMADIRAKADAAGMNSTGMLIDMIDDLGEAGKIDVRKLINNSVDASAQAVTMGQAIFRDFITTPRGAEMRKAVENGQDTADLQKAFSTIVGNVQAHLKPDVDRANTIAEKFARETDLDTAVKKYETDAIAKEAFDKYSAAGIAGLEAFGTGSNITPGWDVMAKHLIPKEGKDVRLADNKVFGEWARKKLFKPPVMTITYGAGAKAFRNNATAAFDEMLAHEGGAAHWGMSEADFRKIADNKNEMVERWVDGMLGQYDGDGNMTPGIIQKTLGLPTATELIRIARDRKGVTLYPEKGTEGPPTSASMDQLLSGDILRIPGGIQGLLAKSEQYFPGMKSIELGLWVAKLELGDADFSRSIANMANMIDKAVEATGADKGSDAVMAKLQEVYQARIGYMTSLQSNNRMGFHTDSVHANNVLRETGADLSNLTPMARESILNGVPLYQATSGSGAQRKFGTFDGANILRNQSQETDMKHSDGHKNVVGEDGKPIEDGQNIGQSYIADAHKDIFGTERSGADYEQRVKSAVITDMLSDLGSVITPPSRPDGPQFKLPTLEDFYRAIYQQAEDGVDTYKARQDAALALDARIKELAAQPTVSRAENYEYVMLQQLLKSAYGRDKNGNVITSEGSGLIATQMNAQSHFAAGGDGDAPTSLGVPHLKDLAHRFTDERQRQHNRDEAGLDDGRAFTPGEVLTVSPIDPEWVKASRESRAESGVEDRIDFDDPDTLKGMADEVGAMRTENSIAAEMKSDVEIAKERGISVEAMRLDTALQRIDVERRQKELAISKSKGDKTEALLKLQKRTEYQIIQAYKMTTGRSLRDRVATRNPLQFPRAMRSGKRGKSAYDALANTAIANRVREMTGLMMGPSDRAGLDMRLNFEGMNVLPQNQSRGPMAIFAMDYQLMGGSARDYVMMTVVRMADQMYDGDVQAAIRSINETGFVTQHQRFFESKQYTADEAGLIRNFEDSMVAKALMSKDIADKYKIEFRELEAKFDAEIGANLPHLPKGISTDDGIKFLGVREHFEANPSHYDFIIKQLPKDAREGMTKDVLAAMFSMSRETMVEKMGNTEIKPGEYQVVMPRQNAEGKVDDQELDYRNGVELQTHVVDPKAAPILTPSQLLIAMNMGANRAMMDNIILSSQLGMDIDMNSRLDSKIQDADNPFGGGTMRHGFSRAPMTQANADKLIEGADVPSGLIGRAQHGDSVVKAHDLDTDAAARAIGKDFPKLKDDWYDNNMIEAFGIAEMIHRGGLHDMGQLSPSGADLLRKADYTDPQDRAAVSWALVEMQKRDAEVALREAQAESEAMRNANSDTVLDALSTGELSGTTHLVSEPYARESDNPNLGEDTSDYGQVDSAGGGQFIEEWDSQSGPTAHVPLSEKPIDQPENPAAGNIFAKRLRIMGHTGNQAAANAGRAFENLTGRAGGEKDRISDFEAMSLIEMTYLDQDLRNAVWGGEVYFQNKGELSVRSRMEDIYDYDGKTTGQGKLSSMMSGLSYVKKKINNNDISAGAYMLLHEMVERLDIASKMRSLEGSKRGADASQAVSQMNKLFIENFGTAVSRTKFRTMLESLGLYDKKMAEFLDATEKLSDDRDFSGRLDEQLSDDRAALTRDAKTDADLRQIRNEGFTQILTMAMFSKQMQSVISGKNKEAGVSGLFMGEIALKIRGKLTTMQNYINKFSFKEPEFNVAAKGELTSNYSWSFVKEGRYQDQILNTIKEMDTAVHYGQPFSMTKAAGEQHGFSNAKSMYDEVGADRNWGGKGEVDGDSIRTRDEIDAELSELMSAASRASGYERTQLQIRMNEISVERGLGEAFHRGDRLNDIEMAAATAHAYDKETGLLDLSKLDGDIRKRAEDDAIDGLLNSVDAGRSSGIGRAANQAAGIFSAGRGVATVANSSSSLIRSLGALINPEMVNTRTMTNQPWVSDQVAMDNMASDFHNAMRGLEPFRKKGAKLKGEARQKFNRAFSNAMENTDPAQRRAAWGAMGYKEKQIIRLEGFHQHLFHPNKGLIVRLTSMMAEAGMISRNQADLAATQKYLPKMLMKELADGPGGMQAVRGALTELTKQHLLGRKSLEVEALDGYGFFMNSKNSNAATELEFAEMPGWLKQWYLDAEDSLRSRGQEMPDGFDKLSDAYRAKWVSNLVKDNMRRPAESRGVGFEGFKWGTRFTSEYRTALRNDTGKPGSNNGALSNAGARDEAGNKIGTRAAQMTEANKEAMGVDVYSPATVLDMLAHREAVDLKTGGKLGDSRYIGDRQKAFANDKVLSSMEDTDTMNRLNSILGSSAVYSYATVVQQHGAGVKGMNTTKIIANLRKRSMNNELEMSSNDKIRFEEELNALEDQLRTGYNQRPRHAKNERTTSNRALMALSRMGVSSVSAGNFLLSAFVEVFGGVAHSIGNFMRGDLKVLTDYIKMLSPEARARMMENANGFEISKIHMGINTRLGDLGFDDLEAMRNVEPSDWVTGMEKVGRKMTGFAMMGFGAVTEYSRAVSVAQGVRRLQRVRDAKGGGFDGLSKALMELDKSGKLPKNTKEAVALARQFGIQRDLATHLYQNGHFNAKDMHHANFAMKDGRLTDEGLTDGVNYPGNGNMIVKSMLQHINTKLNLDPRMGNRQIPQGIVEQLLAVLGQFPIIYYSRMRQAAYQGGALGVAGFLLPMLMGEIYYTTLQQAATGESTDDIWDRWANNPSGALLNVLENMQVLGGSSFILNNAVPMAVKGLKTLMGDPEMMAGYKESFFQQIPGPAGLSMVVGAAKKVTGAVEDYAGGNVTRGNQRLASASPVPIKQVVKLFLQNELASGADGIGQQLTTSSGPNTTYNANTGNASTAQSKLNPKTINKIREGEGRQSVSATAGTATGNPTPPVGRVEEPANASTPAAPVDLAGVPGEAEPKGNNSLGEDVADAIKDMG